MSAASQHLLLVGNPNVGKSVIFGLLTGRYAVVSNYPGTTVEIARGNARVGGEDRVIVDTPGTNSLLFPTSDDEVVSRDIVVRHSPCTVIQVADAKNLPRALVLTLELAELGCPMVLCLNMSDEVAMWGMRLDHRQLSEILGIPVIPTVATQRIGIGALRDAVSSAAVPTVRAAFHSGYLEHLNAMAHTFEISRGAVMAAVSRPDVPLPVPRFEALAAEAAQRLPEEKHRSIGYNMLLDRTHGAHEIAEKVTQRAEAGEGKAGIAVFLALAVSAAAAGAAGYALGGMFAFLWRILSGAEGASGFAAWLSALMLSILFLQRVGVFKKRIGEALKETGDIAMQPLWGLILLLGVLYSTYLVVGVLTAGDAVDFITSSVFGEYENGEWGGFVNGPLSRAARSLLGHNFIYRMLFDEDGGLISKGLAYSFGIVGPIVVAFFLLFSLLEDSGYLPRLSVMSDRFFKKMGLSGRAALPMVLGLGCDTMATLATRILPTRKERLLAILLLALAIPCSAQLGIIAGVLAGLGPFAVLAFAGLMVAVLLLVGSLGARVIEGGAAGFLLEVPPFRPPMLRNVLLKTWYRAVWFLREAVPVFLLGSFILWIMKETALLGLFEQAMSPLVRGVLGLPEETARGFLLGFLRRDYAAVEIFSLFERGLVDPQQVFVALVTITLFVPCVANFFVMIKEAGLKRALYMVAFIIPFAFIVGGIVRVFLSLTGITFGAN